MNLRDFEYKLPPELIAQEPLSRRDASRLLVLNRSTGEIRHLMFRDIQDLLPAGSLMVMNDSRVIPARLYCRKAGTGGRIEVLLTRRHSEHVWEGLVKPSRRVSGGCRLIVKENELEITANSRNSHGTRMLDLHFSGDFMYLLEKYGETPLPPYIKAPLDDRERYQTVYAREEGSVAAPTAGLHFTPDVLAKLKEAGISNLFVTLHVGPGTFRPVKVSSVEDHRMEAEYFSLSDATAARIREAKEGNRKIIAVGTTVVRTLESAFGINRLAAGISGWSELFIYPGFTFQVADILLTNFHLPCSTLVMLASAFAGRELLFNAYAEAIRERYRFYSLGDAMLIL